VEFASELCQVAQKNIRSYRGSQACKDISVLEMDATEFQFPSGPLLIYFFNPFHDSIMDKVLDNLSQSLASDPRPVTLICDALYHKDSILRIFRPQQTARICGFSVYANHARISQGLMASCSKKVIVVESLRLGASN
jgi:hypothetical protein